MKKIVLSLAFMCQSAFAYDSDIIEYHLTSNYLTKEACVLNHFSHVALLVDLKANVTQVKDLDIEQVIKFEKETISYENDTQFIQHHLNYPGYYLISNKKNKTRVLYKVTETSIVPIKSCISSV
jgi:hypothetical protein